MEHYAAQAHMQHKHHQLKFQFTTLIPMPCECERDMQQVFLSQPAAGRWLSLTIWHMFVLTSRKKIEKIRQSAKEKIRQSAKALPVFVISIHLGSTVAHSHMAHPACNY